MKTIALTNSLEKLVVRENIVEDHDLYLIRRSLDGDDTAFDELAIKYRSSVYNICVQILDNYSDAEDAAQDVFVRIYKCLPRFRMQSKLSTWIYRITVNQCCTYRRKRRPDEPLNGDAATGDSGVTENADPRVVRQVLQEIPLHYRTVLVLKYYRELTYDEIANVLSWSPEKVKCYLHRARSAFKKAYERRSGGERL